MISKLLHKYDNLKPEHKALADMVGLLVGAVICSGIVIIIASYGLWFELAKIIITHLK